MLLGHIKTLPSIGHLSTSGLTGVKYLYALFCPRQAIVHDQQIRMLGRNHPFIELRRFGSPRAGGWLNPEAQSSFPATAPQPQALGATSSLRVTVDCPRLAGAPIPV